MLLNVLTARATRSPRCGTCWPTTTRTDPAQRAHIRRAIADLPGAARRRAWSSGWRRRTTTGRQVRLTVDLQPDFALNQPLSPFALAALELLDRESPAYPLDVVSVVEATLEDPRQVLSAQQNRARGEAVAQMKADGIEYEERMELLEDVTYPKPLEDLLEAAFDIYRARPSVGRRLRSRAEVRRPRHVRAGHDVHRVRRLLRARPFRGPGAALPVGRVQGAAADGARGRQDRGAHRPDRVARRARPPGRLEPDRRVGAAAQPGPPTRRPPSASRPGRRRSPPTRGPSGCWSATRCSAGSSSPRWGATTSSASSMRTPAGTPRVGGRAGAYFAEHDEIGTGPDARGPALLIIDEEPHAGPSGRSSTTRPATTTGASAPRSTWRPPTRRAPP